MMQDGPHTVEDVSHLGLCVCSMCCGSYVQFKFIGVLTFFTVQSCEPGRAHTLTVHTAAAILALQAALADVFHHLAALTCR